MVFSDSQIGSRGLIGTNENFHDAQVVSVSRGRRIVDGYASAREGRRADLALQPSTCRQPMPNLDEPELDRCPQCAR